MTISELANAIGVSFIIVIGLILFVEFWRLT